MAATGTVDQMRTPFDDDRFLAPKLCDQTTRYGVLLSELQPLWQMQCSLLGLRPLRPGNLFPQIAISVLGPPSFDIATCICPIPVSSPWITTVLGGPVPRPQLLDYLFYKNQVVSLTSEAY